MVIAQITDLHIDQKGEFPFDIDVRKNFSRILQAVRDIEPDHLVVSGDLCYKDGEADIYKWIKTRLDLQDIPYSIIPGNHDESVLMADIFQLQHLLNDGELYFAKRIGKTPCLFLDSSRGHHSDRQLKWLKRQLKNSKEDLIIFMHHPPVKAGVPFMDEKYPLQDMEVIQEILFQYPHAVQVFCGHYHVEKTICVQNLVVQITPSCFFQIDQTDPEFKVDHHRIALRIIKKANGALQTTVRYFDGHFIKTS
ncbi:MAG: metallophosphoesterase [Bacteroidota bacterium]